MTDNNHPITPPLELVEQWSPSIAIDQVTIKNWQVLAAKAAQWGYTQRGAINEAELQKARDEELEACYEWLQNTIIPGWADQLRAARRPKPKSQAEQALEVLNEVVYMADDIPPEGIATDQAATIRAALERLRELEEGR